VPTIISYQGKLIEPSGEPFADGYYTITFGIYSVPNGGEAVWTEINNAVLVKGGLFSVLLGSVNPIQPAVFGEADRWFGIKVSDATEMVPRQKIASVAYALHAENGVPSGTVVAFAGQNPPAGWLLCNGQAVSRTEYPALFAAVGVSFGNGDGSTTFNVPDLQARFPLAAGPGHPFGSSGGSESKNLQHAHSTAGHPLSSNEMPAHTHGVNDPGHSHTESKVSIYAPGTKTLAAGDDKDNYSDYQTSVNATGISIQNSGGGGAHNHGNTGNGLSTTQDVMNPYLVVNYIIKS
jgi:microcystin-dependent protein